MDPCSDRDKDGVIDRACEGGTDCDDDDIRAYPEAGYRDDLPTPITKGDWNCDDVVTRELPSNLKCSDYNSGVGNCTGIVGFKADPACGETGALVKCMNPTLIGPCVEGTVIQEKRRCK